MLFFPSKKTSSWVETPAVHFFSPNAPYSREGEWVESNPIPHSCWTPPQKTWFFRDFHTVAYIYLQLLGSTLLRIVMEWLPLGITRIITGLEHRTYGDVRKWEPMGQRNWPLLVDGFNHLEKYESQWEGLSHLLWKIKNVPNHQPVRSAVNDSFWSFNLVDP